MTVIVADSKARKMVSDTLVTDEHIRVGNTTKVVRCVDGALAGASDDGAAASDFLAWAKAGRKTRLPRGVASKTAGLILEHSGRILVYDHTTNPDEYHGFAVIGTGGTAALAAHALGHSPEDCVKAACAVTITCGEPIEVFALDPVKKTPSGASWRG